MDWRKSLLLILAIILIAGSAASKVHYEVDANRDQVLLNTTVQLECEGANCPADSWTLTLNTPGNANVTDVSAVRGNLENYEIHSDKMMIWTESERPSRMEAVNVSYRIDEDAREIKDGLYSRSISLPGFSGKSSQGTIEVEDLISASGSHGFRTQKTNDSFKFRGEGPTNIDISFGEGHETDYYEFFGQQSEDTELAYEMVVGTLGFAHNSEKLPVAVLPNDEYNETVNRWSSGRYIDGNIVLREDLESDFLPVLAHETAHAFNEQRLDWDRTSSTWFDEGTAKYIEFLVKNAGSRNSEVREVFGDEVSYERMENGRRYRYTLPPKGDREQLWQYYQEDMGFMKEWDSDSRNREFGYAYSELIIKNYVSQNNSLSELYEKLESAPKAESNIEKWDYYSQYLDIEPCNYSSREKFETCLDRVNSYDYRAYTAEPGNSTQRLEVDELNISGRQGLNTGLNDSIERRGAGLQSFLNRAIADINSLIHDLVASV